jgi:hypothetical protein
MSFCFDPFGRRAGDDGLDLFQLQISQDATPQELFQEFQKVARMHPGCDIRILEAIIDHPGLNPEQRRGLLMTNGVAQSILANRQLLTKAFIAKLDQAGLHSGLLAVIDPKTYHLRAAMAFQREVLAATFEMQIPLLTRFLTGRDLAPAQKSALVKSNGIVQILLSHHRDFPRSLLCLLESSGCYRLVLERISTKKQIIKEIKTHAVEPLIERLNDQPGAIGVFLKEAMILKKYEFLYEVFARLGIPTNKVGQLIYETSISLQPDHPCQLMCQQTLSQYTLQSIDQL